MTSSLLLIARLLLLPISGIDEFGIGSGRDGNFVALPGDNSVNRSFVLREDALREHGNDTPLKVSSTTGLQAGQLVMFWQMNDATLLPLSGGQADLPIVGALLGGYELARLVAVGDDWILLDAPLLRTFRKESSQIVYVPQFANVVIPSGAKITAPAWDGATGGVIAFLVRGTLQNDGSIDASGLGFRGGAGTTSWVFTVPGRAIFGCVSLDGPPDPGGDVIPANDFGVGGARKGEGVGFGELHGRGNLANGAGGGNCHNAGGGGGGGVGRGGKGGSWSGDERDTGGLPGVGIVRDPLRQLVFGGGGGAGEENNGPNPQMPGANGGGIIWARAARYAGNGSILANGATREGLSPPFNDGEGGGGAGGSIVLRFSERTTCPASVAARGGNGGNTQTNHGPGGGGGGGSVLVQVGASEQCAADTSGGIGGIDLPVTSRSAESGSNGVSSAPPPATLPIQVPELSAELPCGGNVQGRALLVPIRGMPDTTVRLSDENNTLCELRLDSAGRGECQVTLALGSHALAARTIGDAVQGGVVSALSPVCELSVEPECLVDYGTIGVSCGVEQPMCFDNVCARCVQDVDCQNRVAAVCDVGSGRCVAAVPTRFALRGGTCSHSDVGGLTAILLVLAVWLRRRS